MKGVLTILTVLSFAVISNAQGRTISAEEYKKAFDFAVSETNAAFPFIFTGVTESFVDTKLIRTKTEVFEREAAGRERQTTTTVQNGKMAKEFQISTDFESVYCSKDDLTWTGPGKYQCGSGIFTISGPRTPTRIEYSVDEGTLDGKKIKVYRSYSVYAPNKPGMKPTFEEKISTVDLRGFFINVSQTNGTLDPITVTYKSKQIWDFKTKFKPVVAPNIQ